MSAKALALKKRKVEAKKTPKTELGMNLIIMGLLGSRGVNKTEVPRTFVITDDWELIHKTLIKCEAILVFLILDDR
jgi:hypothetical protein